jgi:3-dehydroquinate synthase
MDTAPSTLSQTLAVGFPHRLVFTRAVFSPANHVLASVLSSGEGRTRVFAICDSGLLGTHPQITAGIEAWFAGHSGQIELVAPVFVLPGGEAIKNGFQFLEELWAGFASARLCRHSVVVAVGGGALLDAVGFAAATAHRGIPIVRIPTTSLAQGDSGVGVKCAVNYMGRKNWLGSFAVPRGVVVDPEFLQSLPPRERRAGLAEAVKVALVRDAGFLDRLVGEAEAIAAGDISAYEAAIADSARIHYTHIVEVGDPFERGAARPLDFGHWAAHKLEQLSDFSLGHGDAVAIGMAIDLLYARRAGILTGNTADRVLELLVRFGFTLHHDALELRDCAGRRLLIDGLEEFREHLGGRLSIPSIRAPAVRIDLNSIDHDILNAAIDELRQRHG